MELEIVNFKQAKLLKELGFPQEDESYNEYTYIYLDNAVNLQDNHKCVKELMQIKDFYDGAFDSWDMYIAPSLESVAKWLRDEKNIHITPQYKTLGDKVIYYSKINAHCLEEKDSLKRIIFESWEAALSAGIDKAIEILKKESNF